MDIKFFCKENVMLVLYFRSSAKINAPLFYYKMTKNKQTYESRNVKIIYTEHELIENLFFKKINKPKSKWSMSKSIFSFSHTERYLSQVA